MGHGGQGVLLGIMTSVKYVRGVDLWTVANKTTGHMGLRFGFRVLRNPCEWKPPQCPRSRVEGFEFIHEYSFLMLVLIYNPT